MICLADSDAYLAGRDIVQRLGQQGADDGSSHCGGYWRTFQTISGSKID